MFTYYVYRIGTILFSLYLIVFSFVVYTLILYMSLFAVIIFANISLKVVAYFYKHESFLRFSAHIFM